MPTSQFVRPYGLSREVSYDKQESSINCTNIPRTHSDSDHYLQKYKALKKANPGTPVRNN